MKEQIQIGIVAKPQGVKGELKIKSLTDDNQRFYNLESVYIDGVSCKVQSARVSGDNVYLFIAGIADRTQAENYRGKILYVDRQNAIPLKKDRYFIIDILGCKVLGEKMYGTVKDIMQHGSADVYVLDSGIMFPFLEDVVQSVDIEKKVIKVNQERFAQVAVFEDSDEN